MLTVKPPLQGQSSDPEARAKLVQKSADNIRKRKHEEDRFVPEGPMHLPLIPLPRSLLEQERFQKENRPQQQPQADELSQGRPRPPSPKLPQDKFVASPCVTGLRNDSFKSFLRRKDVAFVMFYDPSDFMSVWAKLQFRQAARVTQRPNHAYAAVDCTCEEELCAKECITMHPTFKLYSRGVAVNTFPGSEALRAKELRRYVERAPLLTGLRRYVTN